MDINKVGMVVVVMILFVGFGMDVILESVVNVFRDELLLNMVGFFFGIMDYGVIGDMVGLKDFND